MQSLFSVIVDEYKFYTIDNASVLAASVIQYSNNLNHND